MLTDLVIRTILFSGDDMTDDVSYYWRLFNLELVKTEKRDSVIRELKRERLMLQRKIEALEKRIGGLNGLQ